MARQLDSPLINLSSSGISNDEASKYVHEYWVHNQGWNWRKLTPLLPDNVLQILAAFYLSNDASSADGLVWKYSPSGMFTIKSTYNALCGDSVSREERIWKLIWRVEVPNRIRAFLWLVCKDFV